MDEQTRINSGGKEVDGGEKIFEGAVPAPRALLESVQRLEEFEAISRREFNSYPLGDLNEQVFVRDPVEEGAFDIHLLNVKVVEGS
jgi:hypothetical protein